MATVHFSTPKYLARFEVYDGNWLVPFFDAAATTIGPVIFVDDPGYINDANLMSHEYIHIMQYAAHGSQEVDMVVDQLPEVRRTNKTAARRHLEDPLLSEMGR